MISWDSHHGHKDHDANLLASSVGRTDHVGIQMWEVTPVRREMATQEGPRRWRRWQWARTGRTRVEGLGGQRDQQDQSRVSRRQQVGGRGRWAWQTPGDWGL